MTWNDLPRNPSRATLRQFAALAIVFFGGLGLWHSYADGPSVRGIAFLSAAALIGIPGLIWPARLRLVYVGWMMAVFPIGWLVSHTLLAVLFYGLFTPLAMVFRLAGRDALRLRRPQSGSYWQAKPAAESVARYYRQF